MNSEIKVQHLQPIVDFFNQHYGGDLILLSREIDHLIYMLHFMENDVVSERAIHNSAFLLHTMKEGFMESHSKQIGERFQELF